MLGTRDTAPSPGRRRWIGALTAFVVAWPLIASAPVEAASDVTALTLDGSPGEPITHGRALVFTPDNATVIAGIAPGLLHPGVGMDASNENGSFSAVVGPPLGQELVPGTYTTARFASATEARLDVSGGGTGCNASSGTVTVHEVSIQTVPVEEVLTFAATYVQYCEGFPGPLHGELRFHSSLDVMAAATEPGSLEFGERLAGTTSSAMPVTITNGGTVDLTFGTASITGVAAGDFSLTSDSCSGVTLAPAETCSLSATFTPSDAGSRMAVVELDDTTASGGRDIGLYGTGNKFAPQVSLRLSDGKIRFGQSVQVTARMTAFDPAADQVLHIYAKPYGGTFSLLTSEVIDANGEVTLTHTPKRSTSYRAQFLGSQQYFAATSITKTVRVAVVARGALKQVDGHSGGYALYDYTASCPGRGRGCPTFAVTVIPNHAGKRVCVTLQLWIRRSWRTAIACFRLRLNSRSTATAFFVYVNREVIGIPARVRASFGGDADHLGGKTAWSYFKVRA
ncbi:MAG: choice-of-anchor D domain-containing protein [Actinomycetota bacterium]